MTIFKYLINAKLDPVQEEGIKFALKHHYHINAFDMGLGKTLTAIAVALYHQRNKRFPCLIVCPSYLCNNWGVEINKFRTVAKDIKILNTGRKIKEFKGKADFIITSYPLIMRNPQLFKGMRMVVADEVHYLKSIQAKTTHVFHEGLADNLPDVFMGLSGTPIKNHIPELYSILSLCSYNPRDTSGSKVLDEYSYHSFCSHFCWKDQFKIRGRTITKYIGSRNVEELKTVMKGKVIRRTAESLALEEPKHIDIFVSYRNNKELEKEWEEFNKGTKVNSSTKKDSALKVAPFTGEFVNDIITKRHTPCVVFTCHPDAASIIANKIKGSVGIISGDTAMDKRTDLVNDFQSGDLDCLILTLAGSTGITLTKTNVLVFNDEDWVPENNSQVRGRIYRRGQKRRCIFYYIRGSRTEAHISKVLKQKSETIGKVWSH